MKYINFCVGKYDFLLLPFFPPDNFTKSHQIQYLFYTNKTFLHGALSL